MKEVKVRLNTSDKILLFLGVLVFFGFCGALKVDFGGKSQARRGGGDTAGGDSQQDKEGLGIDAQLSVGLLSPPEHTRYHYGPGEGNIPTNWARHRLAYPRRGGGVHEDCASLPMNHPAFPKNDRIWFYCPPQEADL